MTVGAGEQKVLYGVKGSFATKVSLVNGVLEGLGIPEGAESTEDRIALPKGIEGLELTSSNVGDAVSEGST